MFKGVVAIESLASRSHHLRAPPASGPLLPALIMLWVRAIGPACLA